MAQLSSTPSTTLKRSFQDVESHSNNNTNSNNNTYQKKICIPKRSNNLHDSDSFSQASSDEENAPPYSFSSSHIQSRHKPSKSFSIPLSQSNKMRRAMSLTSFAGSQNSPPTSHFFPPPSPPQSSFIADFEHNHLCYSNSEDEDDDHYHHAHRLGKSRSERKKSINVASLRRNRTMINDNNNDNEFNDTFNNNTSPLLISNRKRRSPVVPRSDLVARAKCFEYLVSAIDEVWAQYCTYTSSAEDEMYAVDEEGQTKGHRRHVSVYSDHELPTSPASLCGEEDEGNYSSTSESYGPRTPYTAGEPSTYLKNPSPKAQMFTARKMPSLMDNTFRNRNQATTEKDSAESVDDGDDEESVHSLAPSEQPGSVKLLNLKQRLMNAKYFLQDLVDREDIESSTAFWNRWDLVKYAAIELVEDDGDDDDIVENVTEDLERGRYYSNVY